MVNFLAVILSFYILALNALSCNDISIDADNALTQVVHNNGDMDHNQDAFDLCTPFCSCHCCHVHTIDFGAINFEPLSPLVSLEVFSHFYDTGEETIYSLFQPPKV